VTDTRRDPDENYILLSVEKAGKKLTIGSIYGPNNFDGNFFSNLERDIRDLNNSDSILAGDWNCTFYADPVLDKFGLS
jgi:hypothetical protein